MTDTREAILRGLAEAVVEMEEERAVELARAALAEGMDAYETIMQGLAKGMEIVSERYERDEYFVPEILICADAMYAALAILRPHLRAEATGGSARVVIGVIEGDVHDIGKNIARMMLEGAGFEVTDLGRDVPVARFVEEAVAREADIIAISTLMSTTMPGMRRVVARLEEEGLRERFRVLIGGGPLSESFAREIGADAYAASASEGVRVAQRLVEGRRP